MFRIESPNIIWEKGKSPYSKKFGDYYFGVDDGDKESEYIFIDGNKLKERFSALKPKNARGTPFCIAETGFGTATNFLLTVECWLKQANEGCCLHYISFEKYPLSKNELLKIHGNNSSYKSILDKLILKYPFLLPGWHDVYLFDGRVRLTLWFGDVLRGLPEFDTPVDAWFLDGFTPKLNKSMWQPEIYSQMARLSHRQTTFATFTAAGNVRRGLEQVGFEVFKHKGFAKKREISFGNFIRPRKFTPAKPWFSSPPKIQVDKKEICVIGAGLAGAAVAYQMAEKGWQVTVIEAEDEMATQASGNLAGAIHPLITADWNIRSQFYLQGYETSLRWLEGWLEKDEIIGDLNGLMQLAMDEKMTARLQDCLKRVGLPADFASWCDEIKASEIIGTATKYSGLFFPKAGWVNPQSIVKKCLSHPNISLNLGQKVQGIVKVNESENERWKVSTQSESFLSPIVVLATAGLDSALNKVFGIEVRPVKGQVSHLTNQQEMVTLKTTVTHKGYSISNVCVNDKFQSVTGATFEAPDLSQQLSKQSNDENVAMSQQALPNWLDLSQKGIAQTSAKIGFRPTTADHLPMIGAVANPQKTREQYYSQSHTHAVFRYGLQQYQTGLYVSNGHGARGLMSVFLAAEIIASQIEGTKQVAANSLLNSSHLERFRIRKWRSGSYSE